MARKKREASARSLTPDQLQRIEESLKPISKDQDVIYRRNERRPIISTDSPARGRLSAHSIRLLGDCAQSWGQDSRYPQALQALGSDIPGYLLFEPVAVYDDRGKHQYPLNWTEGYHRVSVDLRPIFQPRNLEVPAGYVSEIPVSLVKLPSSGKYYLCLHIGEAKIRQEGDQTPDDEEEPAAGEAKNPAGESAPAKDS